MTNQEVEYMLHAIEQVTIHYPEWKMNYEYDEPSNEYHHRTFIDPSMEMAKEWYQKALV